MTVQRDVQCRDAHTDGRSAGTDRGSGPADQDARGDTDDFRVGQQWVGPVVVVSVSGAVDMLSAPRLTEAIATAAGTAPAGLIVDLSKVEFLACAGMSVLIAAHADLTPCIRFGVVADGAPTRRPLTIIGIDTVVALYRTLDDAVNAFTDAETVPHCYAVSGNDQIIEPSSTCLVALR